MKRQLSIFLFASILAFASSCQKKEAEVFSTPIETIAFGSCNRQNLPQPLWRPIIEDHPDLWVWMGDNIYGDSPIMDTLKAKYDLQNQVLDYQELKKSTPIIGIWDDHDYGINDGGKQFAQKEASKQLMLDFLGVPEDAPERKREGAYSSHLFGQGENLVKVLLLDARYFRDTLERIDRVYQTNETGQVLGETQWKWLEEELKNSPAKVHLIVSGIQMLPVEHAYEKWANFPKERERLLNLISKSGAGTPILLSGDRHIAEIMKLQDERFPQGLFEITSSGLTHTWGSISEEPNQFRIGELIAKLNYGLAKFDWEKEEVLFEIKGENGNVYATQKIPFTK
ncbi:alkaline phosphatase D family protein [Algoriphagus sp. CAU 1675]|uniref:alkaline phosphatase D family protein n=1 Tax=Algoriphagus sp. CAU 1675 TaxID=3032597 RepID=UPI0023DB101E|nr:alkaline phosphatase D family protein [Algoriphagus sp. CAU 1675]MDF2157726.1 alkaline phosphatase D family protein [Algoriphagus sp. CAU 1675]